MKKNIFILSIFLISSLFSMEQPEQPSSKRWKEIEEGTLIGKLPVELREEIGKFDLSNFDKELQPWLALGQFENKPLYYSLLIKTFIDQIKDPIKKRYAFEKFAQKFGDWFGTRTNDYIFFLDNTDFDWLVSYFKYTPARYWYPLFEKVISEITTIRRFKILKPLMQQMFYQEKILQN